MFLSRSSIGSGWDDAGGIKRHVVLSDLYANRWKLANGSRGCIAGHFIPANYSWVALISDPALFIARCRTAGKYCVRSRVRNPNDDRFNDSVRGQVCPRKRCVSKPARRHLVGTNQVTWESNRSVSRHAGVFTFELVHLT